MGKKNSLSKSDHNQSIDSRRLDLLYNRVSDHIDQARQNIQRAINVEMIKAYWFIGHEIVEEEQHGQVRAEYGKAILKKLFAKLQAKYKSGFGVDTLEQVRKFFLVYQSDIQKSETASRKSDFPALIPNLSWSQRTFTGFYRPDATPKMIRDHANTKRLRCRNRCLKTTK